MQLSLTSPNGERKKTIEVSDLVFGHRFNEALVHQVVTAYLAQARSGNSAQKNRSAVSGGGKKPWRQKGTGRARAGTIRSPLWRKGGVTFAAQPQDYSQKVNRKMYQGAMRAIWSELIRQDRLLIMDDFTVTSNKTRELIKKLKELELENVLIITDSPDKNLQLAARNLHNISICGTSTADPVSLIGHEKVLVTVPAFKRLEEVLA